MPRTPAPKAPQKPNVFISWAGPPAKQVAAAFRDWLPTVLWNVRPFFSEDDIEKGTTWDTDIDSSLQDCTVGVVFVTPWNQGSPWLNYEAGALARTVGGRARVCTVLLGGLQSTDVTSPLRRFQHTLPTKQDFKKLVESIGAGIQSEMPPQALASAFETMWPNFEPNLRVEAAAPGPVKHRDSGEMLVEILEAVRRMEVANSEHILSQRIRWPRDPEPLQIRFKEAVAKRLAQQAFRRGGDADGDPPPDSEDE